MPRDPAAALTEINANRKSFWHAYERGPRAVGAVRKDISSAERRRLGLSGSRGEMFESRRLAGEMLADALAGLKGSDPVVYALPRGGLPVAAAVAERLGAPLDILLVRKLGAPGHRELAIGALVDGAAPTIILHHKTITELGVPADFVERVKKEALVEIDRRRALLAPDRRGVSPEGRVAIIVDDGLATGATMEAAVEALRRANAKRIVVAVPTAPEEAAAKFRRLADDVICLETPQPFWSVGSRYIHFPQLTDADVGEILATANERALASSRETAGSQAGFLVAGTGEGEGARTGK